MKTPDKRILKASDATVGHVTSFAWSPGLEQNIGLALVPKPLSEIGTKLQVRIGTSGQRSEVRVCRVGPIPFDGSEGLDRGRATGGIGRTTTDAPSASVPDDADGPNWHRTFTMANMRESSYDAQESSVDSSDRRG